MFNRLFTWICWALALYFFVAFQCAAGFPPKGMLEDGVFILVVLFILFLLLPFAQTLKIGNFFEYSAKIQELQSDVQDFKRETRELITLQNSLISNVSQNVNSNVHINIPSSATAQQAEKKLTDVERSSTVSTHTAIEQTNETLEYIENNGNHTLALMHLRRELEFELRRILGKETSFELGRKDRKYPSLMSLWKMYIAGHEDKQKLEPAFRYIIDVCNAAVHAQSVPSGHAEEAISMGLRIIDILRRA